MCCIYVNILFFPWPSVKKPHTCSTQSAHMSCFLYAISPCAPVSFHRQLSQLRGRDRNFTLLHALVEQIMLHEPHLATFTQELAEFETVPGGILCSPRFNQSSKKKKKWFFPFEVCLKWNVYFSLFDSVLVFGSFHQRPDRRSGWWVDHVLLWCLDLLRPLWYWPYFFVPMQVIDEEVGTLAVLCWNALISQFMEHIPKKKEKRKKCLYAQIQHITGSASDLMQFVASTVKCDGW